MEQIKFKSGKTYNLVTNGIREFDSGCRFIFDPGEDSFDEVEKELIDADNVKIVYVINSSRETSKSIVGYTKYLGMEKKTEYQKSSQEIGTVMIVSMSKPEVEERVNQLEEKNKVMEKAVEFSAFNFTDQQAVRVKSIYPKWSGLEDGTTLTKQDEATYGTEITKVLGDDGKLYKVITTHQKQADWAPGSGTESLFTVIDEEHAGTQEDPVPWSTNMICYNGKYYTYNGVLYKCIRDSGIALQYTPNQLLDNYFSLATN